MKSKQAKDFRDNQAAFNIVDTILNNWSCSLEEKVAILGISEAGYFCNFEGDNNDKIRMTQLST